MKVKAALVLAVILFGIVPLMLVLGIGAFLGSNTPTAACIESGGTLMTAENVSDEELTVKDEPIDEAQRKNAAIISSVALENSLPPFAAVVAIEGAIQESELRNIPYGYPGTSAIGLFSQQDAWGSEEDRMDPKQATYMFFFGGNQGQPGLTDIDKWQQMSPGEAVQAVQRSNPLGSGDPVRDHAAAVAAYDQHETEARAIVASLGSDENWEEVQAISSECGEDPIEKMVQAALSRVGQPADDITVSAGTFRMGTYNVHGSNHTGHESAMQRAVPQSTLIKDLKLGVVGLQELRPDQRTRFMELLGDTYDIFPSAEVYGSKQTSANSIIVDMTQFKLISESSTPMPFYFGGQELDIPMVDLEHLETGLEITVINTHDPAKPIYDRLRYLNAEAHAELVDRLAAQGKTVFFTGDFNSGFKVRDDGNTTYQDERSNLTWCIMTRSGVQINGYDDALGRTGCPLQTTADLGEGPVDHVYVPRDGVTTTDHTIVREGTASDHPLVFVDIAIDGAEPSEVSDTVSSAELISWAAGQAGFNLPDTVSGLYEFNGDLENGIEAELLPPETELKRGDIPLWTKDADPDPEDAGIETGTTTGAGTDARLTTYNITVNRQFANYDLAVENITTTYKMDIVGTQELIGDSYRLVQEKVKEAGYGIYPDYAPGLRTVRHSLSGRSIIYNKDRFVLDESKTTMFRHPRYPDDRAARVGDEVVLAGQANVPVAYFTDKATGQPLVVVNFHNVAFARYAKIRYESNLILVDQMKELQADNPGVPIILTGDFNEGTGVRLYGTAPNVTYQERYQNLLYCMFASNGLMTDTGAESDGASTTCPNPTIGGVDYVYATPEVEVKPGSSRLITPADAGTDHSVVYVDVSVPSVGGNVSKTENQAITVVGKEVAIGSYDSGDLGGVLRLSSVNQTVLTGASAEGWIFPLRPGDSHYSDAYGLEDGRFHQGADFGTSGATPPLYAMHSGAILNVGWGGAWGNYLFVETGVPVPGSPGETYKYLYAHLSSIAPGLKVGDTVTVNQYVGAVGDTGNSFGEHLHLSICTDTRCLDGSSAGSAGSVDPIPLMGTLGIWPQSNAA